jgi:hypothetical protein
VNRTAELARGLAGVRQQIADAARAAGRDPATISLVAVSKTFPATDVAALAALGVQDFGENRHQEAAPKAALLPQLRWHFVGQLQRNKARQVAGYAHLVHSVDRQELLAPLDRGAADRDRPLAVLVQVGLGEGPARGGVAPAEVLPLAAAIAGCDHLRLTGVMGVAPPGPGRARPAFALLCQTHQRLLREHPSATVISAGMSGDLVDAIVEGATLVRVGSALFGARPPLTG